MTEFFGLIYMVGFWGTLGWVYKDAQRQEQRLPFIQAAGVALIFPVGLSIYLWLRD